MFTFEEQIYKSNLEIKYVLEEDKDSKHLLVVFSGFNSPTAKIQHSYNYMRTLRVFKCNKLYILDAYGPRGCYYLGENMSFEVETSVISLITYIMSKFKLDLKNVITVGSSKGGAAALYYGLKYNFGYIIAGAPQTKIADYILDVTENTAIYMLGEQYSDDKKEKLNTVIYKQLEKEINSQIIIFTSKNDWQYKNHIVPFIDALNSRKIKYYLYESDLMKSHADIALYYPEFLIKNLLKIIYGFECINWEINSDNEKIILNFQMEKRNDISIKCFIDSDLEKKEIILEEKDNRIEFIPQNIGNYKVNIKFVNLWEETIYEFFAGKYIIGKNKFKLNHVQCYIDENILYCKLDIEEYSELNYAYYIMLNGVVIEKRWYSREKSMEYKIEKQGKYSVMYFLRDDDGNKVIDVTEKVEY